MIDTNACSGSHPDGCATLIPPEIHTGGDPESVILDSQTQTLYTANWVDNDVSVIDATRCNADFTDGCRHPAPAVTLPRPGGVAVDSAVHTTYVTTASNTVSMIDTRRCNAHDPAGCAAAPPTVAVGVSPGAIAVDRRTHTVYVANQGAVGSPGTVSVFDAKTCNATRSAGCSTVSTLQVPGGIPFDIAVNPLTDTVYVATITTSGGPNLISMFNGATCNATHTTGCDQAPANAPTGNDGGGASVEYVSVSDATNTVYATSDIAINFSPQVGDSVYVINGATCDAANATGCSQPPATVTLGYDPVGIADNPYQIAVDPATDTVYTANLADGEGPGTVSVINGATCNGHNTSGCGQTPATPPPASAPTASPSTARPTTCTSPTPRTPASA